MDKKTLIAGITGLVIGAAVIYLALPNDKQSQITETTEKLIAAYCSDKNDKGRQYILDMLQKEYPDQKIEDLCK